MVLDGSHITAFAYQIQTYTMHDLQTSVPRLLALQSNHFGPVI